VNLVQSDAFTQNDLLDWRWRLEHLYWIVDKDGHEVQFKLNAEQRELLDGLHRLNVILKARQLGMTTLIALMFLDTCIFNPNVRAVIIAHTKDDAAMIFRTKIVFPYDHLPKLLREGQTHETAAQVVDDDKRDGAELVLENGSSIRVAVSARSGTVDYLLVSEYGKICARFPDKAVEIKTGSEQAVGSNGVVFYESTAEGPSGDFADMCKQSQEDTARSKSTPLHRDLYKFFFFPWWHRDEYEADIEGFSEDPELAKYFLSLEDRGIRLNLRKRIWYTLKRRRLKDKMFQEYPSVPDEAFWASQEGAYYADLMSRARMEGRIKVVPYDPDMPVHTFWDLGMDDSTVIWFAQIIPTEIRLIDYHEDSGKGLDNYVRVLQGKNYVYGEHFAPPDIRVRELSTGISRLDAARKLGIAFRVVPAHGISDGIDATRSVLCKCWFDQVKCGRGIKALECYRKEWNEKLCKYSDSPLHDWSSHGSDAFRYMAVSSRFSRLQGVFGPATEFNEEQSRNPEYDPLGSWR